MQALPRTVVHHMQQHHGLVTRQWLMKHGITQGQLTTWLRSGRFEILHEGVYRLRDAYVPDLQELYGATLSCGPRAVAGPHSSMRVRGVKGFDRAPIDVVVPRHHHPKPRPFRIHRTDLGPADRVGVGVLPTLGLARALMLLALQLPERELVIAVDEARRVDRHLLDSLRFVLHDRPRDRGGLILARLVSLGRFAQENGGERELARLLALLDPPPRSQVKGLVPGRRLDFAWIEALYALELDGRGHHLLPTDRDNDGFRDLECTESHVLVHRITMGMIRQQPTRTLGWIRSTYTRRVAEVQALIAAGLLPDRLVRMVQAATAR